MRWLSQLISVIALLISLDGEGEPIRSSIGGRHALSAEVEECRYSAADYVQDGLVSLWDAIENADWGVHDEDAHIWNNLIPGGTSFGNTGMVFGQDFMRLSTSIYSQPLSVSEKAALAPGQDYTVEILMDKNRYGL